MAKEKLAQAGVPPPLRAKTCEHRVRKKPDRASGLRSRVIQITVGPTRETFQVHQDILCASSPFFRTACKGPWKESQDGWIDLPEDEAATFEVYVQWLYLDYVNLPPPSEYGAIVGSAWPGILSAYRLGDKLLDIGFKNTVIDFLIQFVTTTLQYPCNQAREVYDTLPESSPFRRLYVDFWAWAGIPAIFDEGCSDAREGPAEFFRDIAKTQIQIGDRKYRLKEVRPWVLYRCQYHEHLEGTPKCVENEK